MVLEDFKINSECIIVMIIQWEIEICWVLGENVVKSKIVCEVCSHSVLLLITIINSIMC